MISLDDLGFFTPLGFYLVVSVVRTIKSFTDPSPFGADVWLHGGCRNRLYFSFFFLGSQLWAFYSPRGGRHTLLLVLVILSCYNKKREECNGELVS